MAKNEAKTSFSREEDYRDYDDRNIDDGWPYADQAGAASPKPENRAYGETPANFDRERNEGFRVDGVDENGLEENTRDTLQPDTIDREDSDELEARVTDVIENIEDIDVTSIDVHADGNVVTLEGSVDTLEESRKVELAAMSVAGVHRVRNNLQTIGVDSHIPSDDD